MHNLIFCFCCCLFALTALAEERIPGTQVTLNPPEAFEATKQFNGYMNEATGASIMVIEIPGPYQEVAEGMTAEAMAAKGMKLITSEAVKIGSTPGKLMRVQLAAADDIYLKWLLVFGDQTTVMIHGTAPQAEFEKIADALRASMLAAKWDPSIEVGMLEALPFTMKEAGDLKFAFKMASGVALTLDGVHPQREIEKPLVVVTVTSSPELKADADPKTYAHVLLGRTAGVPKELTITEEGAVNMCAKKGYRVAATGSPEGSETKVHYELSVIVEEGRLAMLFGRVADASKAQYQPVFATLRNSIELAE